MEALSCNICGGKLVMGVGGIATCESCGMQYSPEILKEKVQEILGAVRVNNTQMIENYLTIADNAYNANNLAEAESYGNKIIEIDPANYKAWLIKGKAAGWQSTVENIRLSESVSAFVKAIKSATEDEKESIVEDIKSEISKLGRALIEIRGERFVKWPDEEETNGFKSDVLAIFNSITELSTQAGVNIPVSEIAAPIAEQINQSVVLAWQNTILPDSTWIKSDANAWATFIARIDYCTDILLQSINLCEEDDAEDIFRYENLIYFHKEALKSCSFNWAIVDIQYALAREEERNELISQYENKIAEIKAKIEIKDAAKKAEEANNRIKEYWDSHVEVKKSLDEEKNNLIERIEKLTDEIAQIPGITEQVSIQKRIESLDAEKSALGVLKIKEKKALKDQIDAAEAEVKKISPRIDALKAAIQEKIIPLQDRLNAINDELTKAR